MIDGMAFLTLFRRFLLENTAANRHRAECKSRAALGECRHWPRSAGRQWQGSAAIDELSEWRGGSCGMRRAIGSTFRDLVTTSVDHHMPNTRTANSAFEAGVFDDVDAARQAVHGLLAAGFTSEQINVVCSDETKERYFWEFEHQEPAGTFTPKATIAGGTIGAMVGGLAVVVSAAATGSLALWAAGPITAWAGGVAGGLVGAMMTRGVEKEIANFYQQAVVDGRILVAAEDNSLNHQRSLAKAAEVLAAAGAKPLPLREG
jgi:hypothetical protein